MMFLGVVIFYILLAEFYTFCFSRNRLASNYDVILLLGCNGNPQSPLVLDRVDHTVTAAKIFPKARIMVSGNERRKEVSVNQELLQNRGLTVTNSEGESFNTWQNMQHSRIFIKAGEKVLIVTSGFHQRRALAMARSLGYQADAFFGIERRYKKSALYMIKERLSIYLNFPRMIFAKKIF